MSCASCGLPPWWCARHRYLTAPEDFDDAHGAAAERAWFAQGERCGHSVWLWYGLLWRARTQQHADFIDIGLALGAGQQTVMADAMSLMLRSASKAAQRSKQNLQSYETAFRRYSASPTGADPTLRCGCHTLGWSAASGQSLGWLVSIQPTRRGGCHQNGGANDCDTFDFVCKIIVWTCR